MTHLTLDVLMAYRDGELALTERGAVEAHLGTCAECRARVADGAALSDRLARWTVDAPPSTLRAAVTPRRPVRRQAAYWAAAAVVIIGLLSSVRVQCAPGPTCDRHRLRLAFLPDTRTPGLPEQAQSLSAAERADFEREWLARPRVDGAPRVASGDHAPLPIVWFIDWQCPACRAEYLAFQPVLQEVSDQVRVARYDFPLDRRCNPNVAVALHPAACDAAAAVRLSEAEGTADAMIAWLLDHQSALTPASVAQAAAEVGHIGDFAGRLPAALTAIATDPSMPMAGDLRIASTPTFILNGVVAARSGNRRLTAAELRAAIEIERARR